MLSDRIKKFGLQSNTEPGSDPKTEQPDGAAVTDSTADEGGSAQDKVADAKAVPSASNDNAAQQTAAAARSSRVQYTDPHQEYSRVASRTPTTKPTQITEMNTPATRTAIFRCCSDTRRVSRACVDRSPVRDGQLALIPSATARKTMVAPTADPTSHIRTRLKQTMAAKHIRTITSRMSTQTPTVTESTPPDIAEPIPGKAGS